MVANYGRIYTAKKTVNGRRINKETKRHNLAEVSFVDFPRLVKKVARKS